MSGALGPKSWSARFGIGACGCVMEAEAMLSSEDGDVNDQGGEF